MRDFGYSAWVVGDKSFVREICSAEKLCENDVFTLGLLQLEGSQSVVGLGALCFWYYYILFFWSWQVNFYFDIFGKVAKNDTKKKTQSETYGIM